MQRRLVTLRLLDEVSTVELTSELGLTAGHVAVLLYRAKQSLLLCMQE